MLCNSPRTERHSMSTYPPQQMPYGGPPPQQYPGPAAPLPIGAFIGLGGAVLALIGSCGSWISATFFGSTYEASGLEGHGKFTLILAIIAAAVLALGAFLPMLRTEIWPPVVGLVAAGLILLFVIITLVEGARAIGGSNAMGAGIGFGWGFYLLIIAVMILVAGAVIQLLQNLKLAKARPGAGQPFPGGPQGYPPHPQYGQQPPQGPPGQPRRGYDGYGPGH